MHLCSTLLCLKKHAMHIYVFFEASHGKSKSDGLGGVVKGYASREVTSKNVLMRNTKRIV